MAQDYSLLDAKEFTNSPMCPDLDVTESQKTEKWYRQAVRYFALFYNTRRQMLGVNGSNKWLLTPYQKVLENFAYSLGLQQSGVYSFFTPDFQGVTQDELGIVPGKKLASLTNFMMGTALKMINNMRIEAMCISPDAKTKETELTEKLLFSVQMDKMLSELEASDGMSFSPAGDFKPEVKEDVIRFMEKDFKEMMMSGADLIAKGLLYENDFINLFLEEFKHAMVAGYCGIEVRVENGRVILDHIPSQFAIIDKSFDNPFNNKARFAGRLSYLTPTEIFSRFDCTDEEKKIINGLATTKNIYLGQYNFTDTMLNATNPAFPYGWWSFNLSQPVVAVVSMYFKARQDLGFKEEKTEFGNLKIKKVDYKKRKSDYEYEGWEQATLIGNLILKNYGAVPNRVGAKERYLKNDCPIKFFLPNISMGEIVSVVDMLKDSQNRIDAINTKIIDLIGKDIGNVTLGNGAAMGNIHLEKFLAELKMTGFTMVNSSTGEPYDDNQLRSIFMSSKIGGSDYIKDYMNFKEQEKREMEEIANIPLIALGQQKSYTGMGVQQTTIDQSTLGTYTLYNGIVQWYASVTQYATNVAKWVMTIDDDFSSRVQVGDMEFAFLKLTRDIRLEEIGVRLVVKDIISDQAKERIRAYVQAFVQNGQLDPLDALMIDRSESYTDMINDLEYSIRKKERNAKQAQAQQQMIEIAENEQNRELQAQQTQMQTESANVNADKKVQADVLNTAIKADPSLVQQL